MKTLPKLTLGFASLAITFLGTQQKVSAGTFTFTDIDHPEYTLLGKQDHNYVPYTGSFDIITGDGDSNVVITGYTPSSTNGTFSDVGGFVPGTLTSATAFFYLKRANDPKDLWDINVNIWDFLNGATLPGNRVTVSDGFDSVAFDFLNNNGVISYTVSNLGTSGFILDYARLEAKSEIPGVPDGGATLTLLGVGLLAIGAFRRKIVEA
jgi:hypothetical protein